MILRNKIGNEQKYYTVCTNQPVFTELWDWQTVLAGQDLNFIIFVWFRGTRFMAILTTAVSPNVTELVAKETDDPGRRKDPWLDPRSDDPDPWLVSEEIEVTDDRPIRCAMAAALSAARPAPWSAFNSCAVCRRISCAWALKSRQVVQKMPTMLSVTPIKAS